MSYARSFVLGALLVAIPVLPAAPAAASTVACGQVITRDVALDSDLSCPGDGLVIGADRITVDLRGHAINGTSPFLSTAGIRNDGHRNVTIRDGSIDGFRTGIELHGATGNSLVTLAVGAKEFMVTGVALDGGGRNRIHDDSIGGFQTAVSMSASARNRITRDQLGAADGVSLLLVNSDRNLVSRNTMTAFGAAIVAFGSANRVRSNVMHALEGTVLSVGEGSGNVVLDNDVSGSVETDGIGVASTATNTLVKRNTSTGNHRDGIRVDDATATITRNVANDNGNLGIEAVPGVTDGGGNRATGNGNPLQCVNVACS